MISSFEGKITVKISHVFNTYAKLILFCSKYLTGV